MSEHALDPLPDTLDDHEWISWLRLSLAEGIGRIRANHLLDRYGTPEGVLAQSERELAQGAGLPAGIAAKLASSLGDHEARNELARLRKLGATLVHLRSERYPPLLRETRYPPVVLGYLGQSFPVTERAVAIVGSRQASARAIRIAHDFAREIAEAGVVVVSGLAKGIDRAAHEGALAARDGKTVAVLGNGLARVYPSEHARLAARIRERGALVSELPADAPPSRHHFPMRNRIIAGMSRGTLVLAAGDESGALITARHSNEEGRDVFAIPGSLDDPLARGCHKIVKGGWGQLVEGARDVLLTLKLVLDRPNVDERPALRPREKRAPLPGVPGEIEAYLEASGTTRTFDEIVIDNRLDARAAMSALGFLAVRRRVKEIPGVGYAVSEA
jgi:DNA processing protein